MSNRDPIGFNFRHLYKGGRLNPSAGQFQPGQPIYQQQQLNGNMSHSSIPQVSHSFPYNDLEGKVTAVEQDQISLRHDFEDLQIAYSNLAKEVDTLKRGGWSVEVGPFKTYTADPLSNELDSIKFETERAFSNASSYEKVDGNGDTMSGNPTTVSGLETASPPQSVASVPPHLRHKLRSNGAPQPQLNGSQQNGAEQNGTKE